MSSDSGAKMLTEQSYRQNRNLSVCRNVCVYLDTTLWGSGTRPVQCLTPLCWWRQQSRTEPCWDDPTAFSKEQGGQGTYSKKNYCGVKPGLRSQISYSSQTETEITNNRPLVNKLEGFGMIKNYYSIITDLGDVQKIQLTGIYLIIHFDAQPKSF